MSLKDKFYLIYLALTLITINCSVPWNFDKGGFDWPKSCKGENQAPLDLSPPFKHQESKQQFFYSNMFTEYAFYNNGNNLILEGDFGFMKFNGETYFSSEIHFYSPALHTITHHKMPFEMQIIHHDSKGNKLAISVLFKYSNEYSLLLGKLGFDHKSLRRMKAFKPKVIKASIDLSKYFSDSKDFFYYNAKESNPPCTANTTYLILTDVLKVSKTQLDNFPKMIKNKSRNVQIRGNRKIFTTFKLRDAQEKAKVLYKRMDVLDKIKKEKEDFIKLKIKLSKRHTKKNKIKKLKIEELKKVNVKLNKKIKDEIEKIGKKKVFKKKECNPIVPFKSVKETSKALDKYKKILQPDVIKPQTEDSKQTMVFDREFPKNNYEIKRLSIEQKQKLLKKLYKKSKKLRKNSDILLQIDNLEQSIKLDILKSVPEEGFLSFLVMDDQVLGENLSEQIDKLDIENSDVLKNLENKLEKPKDIQNPQIEKAVYKINPTIDKNNQIKKEAVFGDNDAIKVQNTNETQDLYAKESNEPKHKINKELEKNIEKEYKRLQEEKKMQNKLISSQVQSKQSFGNASPSSLVAGGDEDDDMDEVDKKFKEADKIADILTGNSKKNVKPKKIKKIKEIKKPMNPMNPMKPMKPMKIKKTKKIRRKNKHIHILKSITHIDQTNKPQKNFNKYIPNKIAEHKKKELKRLRIQRIKRTKSRALNKEKAKMNLRKNQEAHLSRLKFNKMRNNLIKKIKLSEDMLRRIKELNKKYKIEKKRKRRQMNNRKKLKFNKVKGESQIKQNYENLIKFSRINNKNPKNKNLKPSIVLKNRRKGNTKKLYKNNKLDQNEDIFKGFNSVLKKSKRMTNKLNKLAKNVNDRSNINQEEYPEENINPHDELKIKIQKLNKKLNNSTGKLKQEKKGIKRSPKKQKTKKTSEIKKLIKKTFEITDPKEKLNEKKPQITDFDSTSHKLENLKIQSNNLDRKHNPPQINEEPLSNKIKELKNKNIGIIENKLDNPDKKKKLLAINSPYNTDTDYNKEVFTLIKIAFENIIKEFTELDKINENLYGCRNNLLNSQGDVKINKKNLGRVVKFSFHANKLNISFDEKVNKVYDYIYKTLMNQNKLLSNSPDSEVKHITAKDIDLIVSGIIQTTVDNINDFNKKEYPLIKVLVIEVLQNIQIILIAKNKEHKTTISTNGGKVIYSTSNQKPHVYEETIITKNNVKMLRPDRRLFIGPNLRREAQLQATPGKGRKAINKEGVVEKTEIFDISNWPDSCKTDYRQSPININRPYKPLATGLKIRYKVPKGNLFFINDGFKLILKGSFGKIFYGIHEYEAKEIHFHSPSEHTFGDNEMRSPFEMQIIHTDIFGNLAGVAVLFNLSKFENRFLKEIGFGVNNPLYSMRLRNSENIEIAPTKFMDLGFYLNRVQHYVHYVGSVTSPPCNKNVQWFVLLEKLHITENQLNYFPVMYGMISNVRGIQDPGDRIQEII